MTDEFPEPHMDPLERAMREDGLLSTDRPLHCLFPKCGCGSNPCRATLSPVEGTLGYLTPKGFYTIAPPTNAYTLVINGEGAKPLLTLRPDGTIETALEYADEAARVFLSSLSDKWRLILDAAAKESGQ